MAPRNIKPGVYAPVLTFFKAGSQDIDLETFKKHVVYMGERGVGPVVCGSMGEAPMLSEDERLQLVRSARSALDNAGLELPLIVGTGLSSTRGTIDLSRKVAAAGADIVIVIPSGYYASLMTRAALKKFFLEVSQASPIPVLTYNFPNAAGGVDMDSELLEEIARDCPNVCGAKLTCSQIGKVTRLAGVVSQPAFAELYPRSWRRNDDQPPFVVLGGFADFLLPSLIAQAHGAIAGMGNFAPRTLRRLYDVAQEALKTGDIGLLGDAQKLQAMVSQADFPTSWVHIPGAKRLLEDLRGYGGLPREPLRPVDEEAYQKMMRNPAVIQLLELEKSLEAGGEEDALSEQIVPSNLVSHLQTTISPVDQTAVVTRALLSPDQLDMALSQSQAAFELYRDTKLEDRIAIAERFLDLFAKNKSRLSEDLCRQIGRPLNHCAIEVDGTIARGKHMISIARACLADVENPETDTAEHRRFIKRIPVGPVLVISPWNYPWFCQINAVLPALLAGNSVLLKPSPQTPLCGEHFADLYYQAGLPQHVLQVLHITPEQAERAIKDVRTQFVMFTGSVAGGHAVIKAASDSFKAVGVELGGKDPAYVRADADLEKTVPALVDGVYFNAGQSCCSVERIYVNESIFDAFIESFVEKVKQLKLGDPKDNTTSLGPVVSRRSAAAIRKQIADAKTAGAQLLVPESLFPLAKQDTNFVAPQVLVNVNHSMDIMTAETFGPVVGIMKVSSDAEAVRLMNDSPYGLTASVWTDAVKSLKDFEAIVDKLETGTVYLNNADNLDPALAWSGVKDSGRGVSLSKFGFDAYTRTKSVNIRT